MTVQMTFTPSGSTNRKCYKASHNGVDYYVFKSQFGWHAGLDPVTSSRRVDKLVYDNRGQAEEACNIHAERNCLIPSKFYVVHLATGQGFTPVSGPYDDQQKALAVSAGKPVLTGHEVSLFYSNPKIIADA